MSVTGATHFCTACFCGVYLFIFLFLFFGNFYRGCNLTKPSCVPRCAWKRQAWSEPEKGEFVSVMQDWLQVGGGRRLEPTTSFLAHYCSAHATIVAFQMSGITAQLREGGSQTRRVVAQVRHFLTEHRCVLLGRSATRLSLTSGNVDRSRCKLIKVGLREA